MSRPHRKLGHYKVLIARMVAANAAGTYLEASWLAYAILEDRLVSVLLNSGGAETVDGKKILNFGRKLTVIQKRSKHDKLLAAYFTKDWLRTLRKWSKDRNALMHAMADASTPIPDIAIGSQNLARDGETLVHDACRQARLLHRNRDKIAMPALPYRP